MSESNGEQWVFYSSKWPTWPWVESLYCELKRRRPGSRRWRRVEKKILKLTETWDEHPPDYDGPCFCYLCLSYGE